MVEKVLSSVGASMAKAVTAVTACANAVVCQLAKNAIGTNTRQYLMFISIALLLVMLASFVVVCKKFWSKMHDEAQNGVHIAA